MLIEQRFGPSTEKYWVEQADLFFNEPESLVDVEDNGQPKGDPAPTKRRSRGGRAKLPPELPRIEIVHDLLEEQKRLLQVLMATAASG